MAVHDAFEMGKTFCRSGMAKEMALKLVTLDQRERLLFDQGWDAVAEVSVETQGEEKTC